jgi:hypothetical protein
VEATPAATLGPTSSTRIPEVVAMQPAYDSANYDSATYDLASPETRNHA